MNLKRTLITLSILLIWSSPAEAWGPNGHRIVAQIAEKRLSSVAKKEIVRLIGPVPLALVSTWADEIKSDPSWQHASPWHYINVPPDQAVETARRSSRGDVIEAIGRFEGVLRDRQANRQDQAEALKFLVHLVADVHQPLHVGYASDRGGNDVRVRWFGKNTNLHAVWDEHLIEGQKLSYTEFVAFIDQKVMRRKLSSAGLRVDSSVIHWVRDSRSLLPAVYDFRNASSGNQIPNLGYDYVFRNMEHVKSQLLIAGYRLAYLLNDIFKDRRRRFY